MAQSQISLLRGLLIYLSPYGIYQICFSSPTVAVMQWRNELNAHTDGLKVLVWHGSSRESDVQALKKYDVVSDPVQIRATELR